MLESIFTGLKGNFLHFDIYGAWLIKIISQVYCNLEIEAHYFQNVTSTKEKKL